MNRARKLVEMTIKLNNTSDNTEVENPSVSKTNDNNICYVQEWINNINTTCLFSDQDIDESISFLGNKLQSCNDNMQSKNDTSNEKLSFHILQPLVCHSPDGNKKDSSVADNDLNGPVVILDTLCEEESDDTFNEISVQPDNRNVINEEQLQESVQGKRLRCYRGQDKCFKDTRAMRKERKDKRNSGLGYITSNGKTVLDRKFKSLTSCRMKCQEKVSELNQKDIFTNYWKMNDFNRRVDYISSLIDINPKQCTRKRIPSSTKTREITVIYHLINNKVRIKVCKGCFQKTFGESTKFFERVIKNKNNSIASIPNIDKRGLGSPLSKIPDHIKKNIIDYFKSIPTYKSHYTRKDSSKKYLSPHWTLNSLYQEYKSKNPEMPINRKYFESLFHDLKLSIKKPNKDTCMTCDKLTILNKSNPSEETTNQLICHQKEADLAYQMKSQDKSNSKDDPNQHIITFDMQQCLPTPVLTSSLAFYKRQLWTYNLTIHDCDKNQAHCYLWNETIANRGANDVASCLYKYLLNLESSITHVTMYSDTCGGQNKNSYVSAMCLVVLQNSSTLTQIDHKFLIPGHTHMESDTDHSIIEKKKKKFNGSIEHPHDWATLIRQCGKNKAMEVVEMLTDDFFKFSDLFATSGPLKNRKENTLGQKVNWRQIKWIRYDKTKPHYMFYKNELNDKAFLEISLIKKGNPKPSLHPPASYNELLPISKEKKKDLVDMLQYISPVYKDFYLNLKTLPNIRNIYPDTIIDEQSDIDEETTSIPNKKIKKTIKKKINK